MSTTVQSSTRSWNGQDNAARLNEMVPPAIAVAEGTDKPTVQTHKFIESVNEQDSTGSVDPTWKHQSRINPDSRFFIRLVVAGVVIAGLVAFSISFVSLYAVADWLGLPVWMWWAVPIFIDLAILVYAALVLVHRARGERTWPSWTALGSFTLLSVIANGAHALSHEHDAQWQAYIGVLIAAMVPIAIFVATEQLSRVAIQDLNSRKSEMHDQIELETFEAQQDQKRDELAFEQEQRRWQRDNERLKAQREAELGQREHELELAQLSRNGTTATREHDAVTGPARVKKTVLEQHPSSVPSVLDSELVTYLREQAAQGHDITGALVADYLGVSDRTGRRRVNDLSKHYPELFPRLGEQTIAEHVEES